MRSESWVNGPRVCWGILDTILSLLKPFQFLHDLFNLVVWLDVICKLHFPVGIAFLFGVCQQDSSLVNKVYDVIQAEIIIKAKLVCKRLDQQPLDFYLAGQ